MLVQMRREAFLTVCYAVTVRKYLVLTFRYCCVTVIINPGLTLCYWVTVGAEVVLTLCFDVALWIFPRSNMYYLG